MLTTGFSWLSVDAAAAAAVVKTASSNSKWRFRVPFIPFYLLSEADNLSIVDDAFMRMFEAYTYEFMTFRVAEQKKGFATLCWRPEL